MAILLNPNELPSGFEYPREFVRVVELGIVDLEPWLILEGRQLQDRIAGLRSRYAGRTLVPFARRIDNDDVACWDVDRGMEVAIVHDFASPGWEQRAFVGGFYDWLRLAIDDLIEYE